MSVRGETLAQRLLLHSLRPEDIDPATGRTRERTPDPPRGPELAKARRNRRRIELIEERRLARELADY